MVVEGPGGAFRQRSFFATSGRGAGDPQTCPDFRLWQIAISIQNATARRVRSGPKCLKTRNSKDGCTFPPDIFAPKITPKPLFGGPFKFQSKTYSSHVNGATKVKHYSYIGIGKYLGCVKTFPLGGVRGAQGSLM